MRTIIGLVAAAALAMVAAPASAAADSPWIDVYKVCDDGEQILRCVELHYDTRHHQFKAHAGILDKPGGAEYNVDVAWVDAGGWRAEDVDGWYGWWADGDTGQSPLVACGSRRWIAYSAGVRWQNAATGAIDTDTVKGEAPVCY